MIYFIQTLNPMLDIDKGPIKIGFTDDIKSRVQQCQVGNPYLIRTLGTMFGFVKEERELHVRFCSSYLRGEWFNYSDELRDYIKENAVGGLWGKKIKKVKEPKLTKRQQLFRNLGLPIPPPEQFAI